MMFVLRNIDDQTITYIYVAGLRDVITEQLKDDVTGKEFDVGVM